MREKRCPSCGETLDESNFYKNRRKNSLYSLCKRCYINRREERAKVSIKTPPEKQKCLCCGQILPITSFYQSSWRSTGYETQCKKCRGRKTLERLHRKGRHVPMNENKQCAAFLGLYVAENILSNYFDHMEKMPTGNHGYDFICGSGYKIDAKASCLASRLGKSDGWCFHISKNQVADYFLCLAFDNREALNPLHVWLIPGNVVNRRGNFEITNTSRGLRKWSEYERPLSKVITNCNLLKGVA